MICSTNLDISRLRRVFAVLFFKPEYKKSFLKLFITQQSLFGEDFDKLSEKIVKEQSIKFAKIYLVSKLDITNIVKQTYQNDGSFRVPPFLPNYNSTRGQGRGW